MRAADKNVVTCKANRALVLRINNVQCTVAESGTCTVQYFRKGRDLNAYSSPPNLQAMIKVITLFNI
jgi:hypothetical protein